jgi:hypothetical protein
MSTPVPGLRRATGYQPAARAAHARCGNTRLYELLAARQGKPTSTATRPVATSRGGSQPVRVSSMRSQAIVRELVKQLMQADADEEHRKRMRKILKTRNYPDEDDDDPIDADPMRF